MFMHGDDITDLATGLDHSYAWSQETGEVYGWGSVEYGKLGFGMEENSDNKFIQQPQLFEVFTELSNYGWSIQNIACGYNHTLAVVNIYSENGQQQDDIQQLDQEFEEQKLDSYRSNKQFQRGDFDEKQNQLFVWGHSKDWQLGLETEEQEDVNHPHKLEQTQKIWKNGIKQVSATKGLSMVLTNEGNVYSWGSGEFGRLGYFSETKIQKTPKLIQFKTQLKIKSISAGFYHCLLLSDQGKIYSFGRGTSGQLGLGNFLNQETPQLIQQLNDIVQIKSGESHNLALNKQGHVYSWGINNQGQLGLCDFNRQNQPQIVNKLNQIQIKQIQCGKKHSLALSTDGQVYAWGCNEFGQIGIEGKKHNTQIQANQQLNNSANIFQNNNSFLINLNTLNKGRNINNYSNNTNYKALSQMSSQDYSWLGQQNFNNILDMSNQSQNNQCDESYSCLKQVKQQYLTEVQNQSELEYEILKQNQNLDNIVSNFRNNIDKIKGNNSQAAYFCVDLMDKFNRILKEKNNIILKDNL
ncbi:Regulator of chromosome condensation 1/beta-lactamase-inhibitor protein II [Pseudocohnilembus persalinus]|uniref:Regulator of chromosome condensation 1/beta-lactamase-inhibitor protein II n=1 Tax=Pseudocohnilembus persalinus TaxID=266149 RepID=A0A0V0QZT6_PSEPJ|nr:Regulator of chromosome condensation 1/beta-lactamase-inhibitor protein II [Pseudocohnilembus persalinus]|eukprot:KRX07811.1 Regulator of chromosome condensation 1/beta-lactamase-inhibitor protein II [Pseudocohnilembus persalinus]